MKLKQLLCTGCCDITYVMPVMPEDFITQFKIVSDNKTFFPNYEHEIKKPQA